MAVTKRSGGYAAYAVDPENAEGIWSLSPNLIS